MIFTELPTLVAPFAGAWSDAAHMPVYHDGSFNEVGAASGQQARNRRMFVGVDQGVAVRTLPKVGTRGNIEVRYGPLDDGAGSDTLSRYLSATVDDPGLRWKSPPVVRFGGDGGDNADYQRAVRAVQLVNTALPDGQKMRIISNAASTDPGTGIYINFIDDIHADAWGITYNSNTSNTSNTNQINRSRIDIYRDYSDNGDRQATILLAHELLHALGMFGGNDHVPHDLDSILESGSGIYHLRQNQAQPLSLLYPADREAVRTLYTRLFDGASPQSFGPWASTSTHIHGNGPHAGFGVALRNGYAEPWAYGYLPRRDLARNPTLSGNVTWSGPLLGLTPSAESVAGEAAISVNLGTMAGRANFTALESWAAGAAPGSAGTGTIWGDGDLGYSIAVRGNTFRETGGDNGRLSGIFVGASHEGAAGTLERTDLTAAFGADRD